MTAWTAMLHTLLGDPAPPLPDLPGRRIVAHDEPLPEDMLADITSPTELALVLGITRQAAAYRLSQRQAPHDV